MELVLQHTDNDTFHWNYSGQEHEYKDIPYLLTTGLLEADYKAYLFLLVKASENDIDIRNVLNVSNSYGAAKARNQHEYDVESYSCWFSSHAHCLAFLVGSHIAVPQHVSRVGYGECCKGIPDMDGCNILDKMLEQGADLKVGNYYGDTIMDSLNNDRRGRENNTNFKNKVFEIFKSL
jgi:hypothetical protein